MYFFIFSLVWFVCSGFVQGEDNIPLLMETNCQMLKTSLIYKSLKLDQNCIFYSGLQEDRTLICLMVNLLLLLFIIRQNVSYVFSLIILQPKTIRLV